MPELRPAPFALLLARALAEYDRQGAVFDLPRRSFWHARGGLDLSVAFAAGRAATPLGPAAGPHTQLAQNLAIAWLAGARVLELKTVQALDRIQVPKPSIDAAALGYNVEWSQELRLAESAGQYAAGWLLIHILKARGLAGNAGDGATRFEASVGYDLAGVRSAPVAAFLDSMTDCSGLLAGLREGLPRGLRAAADVEAPLRMVSGVTLSTMHGCPPDEVEAIAGHLFERHGLDLNIKLNPTLYGHDEAEALLRGTLGYADIRLDRAAFDGDLQWGQALGLFDRLGAVAARHGLTLGAKFVNTLAVRNTRRVLEGETVYLSGTALHPLAIRLAARFVEATQGRFPVSFSTGVCAENFPDAVACGFQPVTTSTDLLKPTGYRRLPRYLRLLEDEMAKAGARSIPQFILARAGAPGAAADDPAAVSAAARRNLAAHAARVADDSRYHSRANRGEPPRGGTKLAFFDCASCNNCVVACPNDAIFSVPLGPLALETQELVIKGGAVATRPARLALAREKQWACFVDFCNDCGNCDTFCPEAGGPYLAKPRFRGSREGYEADATHDGLLVERGGRVVTARIGGREHVLTQEGARAFFTDGLIVAELDGQHRLVSAVVLEPRQGHALPLARYHALRLLRDAVLARVNPVSAAFLGEPEG